MEPGPQAKGHEYSNVNLNKELSQVDYENIEIDWGYQLNSQFSKQEDFQIIKKVGRGRYANVFQGHDMVAGRPVAIKILRAISKSKIKREVFITKLLQHPNIVQLYKVVRCSEAKAACIVLQYVSHQDFRTFYNHLSIEDIKYYTRQLLSTLDYVHSRGVMHRDIKPHNVLINHDKRTLKLIDFGLAEFYYPTREYSSKVASLYYKSPEILLGSVVYDYSIDIWAVGMILAGMIFKRTPFVQGIDQLDQIYRISKFLGTEEILQYCKQNMGNLKEAQQLREQMRVALDSPTTKKFKKTDLSEHITKDNKDTATQEALSFLRGLLQLDPSQRLTAKAALEHPFLRKK